MDCPAHNTWGLSALVGAHMMERISDVCPSELASDWVSGLFDIIYE